MLALSIADLMSLLSGGVVGLTLGLIGGGGSILAVPLLLYAVGLPSTHAAIGTSAVAVAANAGVGVVLHARARTVKWPCALVFAVAGVAGAFAGALAGKAVDGKLLLSLFGLIMLAVGALSGFFGIGGGFLIVPGLTNATNMPVINAVGSSLVSVAAFAAATAASYALSSLVDWHVAALMLVGGAIGAAAGTALSHNLATKKALLARVFAVIVILAGLYVTARGIADLHIG